MERYNGDAELKFIYPEIARKDNILKNWNPPYKLEIDRVSSGSPVIRSSLNRNKKKEEEEQKKLHVYVSSVHRKNKWLNICG